MHRNNAQWLLEQWYRRRNWAMSDEFEGPSLNLNKWVTLPFAWAGRRPGLFKPENVTQKNGALKITVKKENAGPGWDYTTGYVRSRAYQKYGYFEIGCMPAPAAFSSAFWLNNNSARHWTEIDVFENGTWRGKENDFNMNTHIFRLRKIKQTLPVPCSARLRIFNMLLMFGLIN